MKSISKWTKSIIAIIGVDVININESTVMFSLRLKKGFEE
jgi:hypothetical protein